MNVDLHFQTTHNGPHPFTADISEIDRHREQVRREGLIGVFEEGIWRGYGYGNISIRYERGILISCSQTSGINRTSLADFAYVDQFDADRFSVTWWGEKPPSSETPMHWVAYHSHPRIGAIVHGHILEYDICYPYVSDFFEMRELPTTYHHSLTREVEPELRAIIEKRGYDDILGMPDHEGGFGLFSLGCNIESASKKVVRFRHDLTVFMDARKARTGADDGTS